MVDLQALWSPLRSSGDAVLDTLLHGRSNDSIVLITAFLIKKKNKKNQTARNVLKCSYKNLAGKSFGIPLCVGFSFWFLATFPKV